MAEKVNIEFDLDLGKSNKSVQQLAKEIRVLTKELSNTSVGSDEFKKLNDMFGRQLKEGK